MRAILFFDLPQVTAKNRREYRKFIKVLKTNGFVMIQESVYVMLAINKGYLDSKIKDIKKNLPPDGNVFVLTVTEKQFSTMEILMGEAKTDVVVNDDRLLEF